MFRRFAFVALVACIVLAGIACRSSANDAHYAELEKQRAEQAAQPAPSVAPSPSPSPSASASPSPGQTPAEPAKNYWTNFRGPRRDGKYEEASIATNWPAGGLREMWRQPVGVGHASFVVADGKAYTIEQRRSQEVVAAYDVNNGRELWTQKWSAEFTDSTGDGPRATPTWDNGRLYALGATGELRCLDANSGAVIWGKNILSDNQASNLPWAMAAAPLIVDDKVIVLPGGTSGKSVVAYNKNNGAPVWRVLSDTQAYVSPMLVELAGRRQIVVVSASRVVGLAPENGALLWEYSWDTDNGINVSQPIMVDGNRFFISSGYGKGAALVEVKGSGNKFTASTIWENTNMKNKFNSSVLYNGYVYGLDEGILVCLDVNTGERKWKNGRYGYGQIILAGDHLIVTSDQGDVALVNATPSQYTEVARFPAVKGQTWNYPAIAGGRLLVRNSSEMVAYDISGK
ncbi:MAG TPA: PQQ-binding-like beta-propeller repeat protein [Pyrinomonadaceae bacterium]|nr:PQQ-binding-like beta-propeller repeat protein [Pyrinomonadaceae bacterium]